MIPSYGLAFARRVLPLFFFINLIFLCEARKSTTRSTTTASTSDENYGDSKRTTDFMSYFNNGITRLTLRPKIKKRGNLTLLDMFPTPPDVVPANGTHTATIIFLHDFHQQGDWWTVCMTNLRQPYMKIVCPSGNPTNITWVKQEGKIMYSWFDFDGDAFPIVEKDSKQVKLAIDYVHHLINEEIKNGIPAERIIVGGHSQGAALALYSALSFPKKLGGLVSLASWHCDPVPKPVYSGEAVDAPCKDIPVFHAFIEYDSFSTKESVQGIGADIYRYISKNVEFRIYSVGSCNEYDHIKEFCKKYVGPI